MAWQFGIFVADAYDVKNGIGKQRLLAYSGMWFGLPSTVKNGYIFTGYTSTVDGIDDSKWSYTDSVSSSYNEYPFSDTTAERLVGPPYYWYVQNYDYKCKAVNITANFEKLSDDIIKIKYISPDAVVNQKIEGPYYDDVSEDMLLSDEEASNLGLNTSIKSSDISFVKVGTDPNFKYVSTDLKSIEGLNLEYDGQITNYNITSYNHPTYKIENNTIYYYPGFDISEKNGIFESEKADWYGSANPDWYKDFEYELYKNYNNTKLLLKGYNGNSKQVFIPSTAIIDGVKYYVWLDNNNTEGFFNQSSYDVVESVVLSPLLHSKYYYYNLPYKMFYGLTKPTFAYLPHWTIYRESTFKNCTGLEKVTINEKREYTAYTFENCKNLKAVTFLKNEENQCYLAASFNATAERGDRMRDCIQPYYNHICKNDFKNAGHSGISLTINGNVVCDSYYSINSPSKSNYNFINAVYDRVTFNGRLQLGNASNMFRKSNIDVIDFTKTIINPGWHVDNFFAESTVKEVYFGNNTRLVIAKNDNVYSDGRLEYNNQWYTNLFKNCKQLKIVDWPKADSSGIVSINSMFYNCESLETLNLGPNFTCSDVSTGYEDGKSYSGTHQRDGGMTDVFKNCKSLKTLDLSNWDNRKCTAVNSMFSGCESLEEIKFGKYFTCESTKTITNMFKDCKSLKYIDMSSFKLRSVEEGWNKTIIANCESLIVIDTPTITNDVETLLDYDFYETSDDHTSYVLWQKFNKNMDASHRIWRRMNTIDIKAYLKNDKNELTELKDMSKTLYFCVKNDPKYFNIIENTNLSDYYKYAEDNKYNVISTFNDKKFLIDTLWVTESGVIKFVYSKPETKPIKPEETKPSSTPSNTTNTTTNNTTVNNTTNNTTIVYTNPTTEPVDNKQPSQATVVNPQTGDSNPILLFIILLVVSTSCLFVLLRRKTK